jgi:DNA polymerase I-like protein with 3'-5' exonuclease and polymerase domains
MRRPPQVTVVDFETDPIEPRPDYPPKPVGVSIKKPGKKPRYFAWGHYSGKNNCSKRDAANALQQVWKTDTLLFHHAKFDIDVAQTHMGCGPISWERVEDTYYLLFLHDPHAPDLKLKPSSERLLGLPPTELEAVEEWIWEHRKQLVAEFGIDRYLGPKGTPLINSRASVGAFVAYAPGDLAGEYANGDGTRTEGLFKYLWPRIQERGMGEAYDRERELMPILLENERVGMRVDLPLLRQDIRLFSSATEAAEAWLRKRLKAPNLNLDSDAEVAEALSRAKIVDDDKWTLTATSKRSVSKKFLLPSMFNDARVASALGYRNRLQTCLKMFMLPWERQAGARPDQHISTSWNQVRSDLGGTRTGRPSTSNPNFLNISKTWHDKDDGYVHPAFIAALPELPLVRKYVLPDVGGMFCHRDYNGQELRLLGHFEDAALMRAYQENPRMDVHDHVRELIETIAGLIYHRTQVKITNFRRIYGGGAPATAAALNVSIAIAQQLLKAHGEALPGVKDLSKRITAMSKAGEPIVTWGGREYYVEEPRYDKRYGRHMTYEYKLLNYAIQGSAADVTKEAILRYHRHPGKRGRFMVTVYDEVNSSSAPEKTAKLRMLAAKHEMVVMKETLESIECDVPMLTDGKLGLNWASLQKYED